MSLVTIKLLEGMYSATQKQQMIERVTDAMVAIQGERLRPVIWVLIDDDVPSGNWGIAGHGLTADRLQSIAAGGDVKAG